MQFDDPDWPITAIVYSGGSTFETFLREATAAMAARGVRLAGLVQHSEAKPDRLKCDMHLQDLATSRLYGISDDRGRHARGCVLNTDRLTRACQAAEEGLSAGTDVLVLSKFGKTEAEGGGFRDLMARALELSVPVLIGAPLVNLASFREFADGLAREIELDDLMSDRTTAIERLLRRSMPDGEGRLELA
ncbi:MAG: DUF2478 domain-containing protein [Mesorhizobium sp.]|uniref:DUF2478 domain-containing protein n=1 Tax=Mesorhizobium sp. TaxID=1871066 RepID=UPI000FE97C26|nr:DUF2478 domain-containing protein [Mesorhizobium sp.]RWM28555.1 MAG: DUF2478 domain-containing protein [Mesorhizobium sp.]TIO76943.1 MAG: DUF2478 domain-containing protein [Mesorhizobium sp.]TIO84753.1 MAG: DUF2478 domain-containing protein [Mesorhizobium sp.]